MKIGFVINSVATENPGYSTPMLAWFASKRGHDVFIISLENLEYLEDDTIGALAHLAPTVNCKTSEKFFEKIQEKDAPTQFVHASEMDILFLRNNPSDDLEERPWAVTTPILFGQIATSLGVLVINDPETLSQAVNKMYFQHYPRSLRIPTIITRRPESIRKFYEKHNKEIVLKPLQGSGGHSVFFINKNNYKNLAQTIEAVGRDGFIIAQEFVKKASESDMRIFLMNGDILEVNGEYAAIKRVSSKDDIRSNIHAGGTVTAAKITKKVLETVNKARPQIKKDGLFLVGLDLSGDKLIEVNVFSPGGLHVMYDMMGVDFASVVIEALEQKVEYRKQYNGTLTNKQLAVL